MRKAMGGFAAALLVAVPMGLLAAPAGAQPYPPNGDGGNGGGGSCGLALSVSAVASGGQVTLTGTGYPTGPVPIFFDDTQIATATAASDFTVTFQVPANAAPGQHTIRAVAANGTCAATATITIVGSGGPGAARSGGGGQLAFTGGWVLALIAAALVCLATGTALMVGSRRRAEVRRQFS